MSTDCRYSNVELNRSHNIATDVSCLSGSSLDWFRTRLELVDLRQATVDLIGVYRLCNSHAAELDAENRACAQELEKCKTKVRRCNL